jgi:hypothetical protein
VTAWISHPELGGTIIVGGRNFEGRNTDLAVHIGETSVADFSAGPGAFLRILRLPIDAPPERASPGAEAGVASGASSGASSGAEYGKLTVTATPSIHVAIEQFDFSRERPLFGYGEGWHEQEYNPATGQRWRWLGGRGELRIADPRALVLHLEGESPRNYFSRPSRLVVLEGRTQLYDALLSSDFSLDISIPASPADRIIAIETDQEFVPAEQSRRTQDRRRLGLRMFKVGLAPASSPGTVPSFQRAR